MRYCWAVHVCTPACTPAHAPSPYRGGTGVRRSSGGPHGVGMRVTPTGMHPQGTSAVSRTCGTPPYGGHAHRTRRASAGEVPRTSADVRRMHVDHVRIHGGALALCSQGTDRRAISQQCGPSVGWRSGSGRWPTFLFFHLSGHPCYCMVMVTINAPSAGCAAEPSKLSMLGSTPSRGATMPHVWMTSWRPKPS